MWYLTDTAILEFIGGYFFPFCRIGAFFLAVPVIGTQLVPARIRLILALITTFIVAPLIPPITQIPSLSLATMVIVIQQVIIGLAMGFILQVVFHVFVLAGQLVAMKMGLGFASMNDPANGVTVTVISQFYLMLSTLLFLSLNGHLIAIEVVVNSFVGLPMSANGLSREALWSIVTLGSWMFEGALVIALPLLSSLLIVNLAFGVMNRAAPQMNVFTVGFPITLLFGLVLIWYSLTSFLPQYQAVVNSGFNFLTNTIGIP